MKEYIYDGTFEGFLTAIFYAYQYKGNAEIISFKSYIPTLVTSPVKIKTEEDKFDRVYRSIADKLGEETLKSVFYLFLSCEKDRDTIALKYLKLCYKYGSRINLAEHNPIISKVIKYCRRVTLEAHSFNGFIRFKQLSDMTFYSGIEPDSNIIPLIMSHFTERFQDQNFIIHDLKRKSAIVYNKDIKKSIIAEMPKDAEIILAENADRSDEFEKLWKEFFKATTIKERINPRLQRQHMPKRYWKHIIEMENES